MNIFLFGIGGTGARVLRSLTYCLASNMGDFADGITFIPMIIDHDAANKDKEIAEKTLEEYRKISNFVHGKVNGVPHQSDYRNFFLPRVKYLSEIHQGNQNAEERIDDSFLFQFGINSNHGGGTFADYIDLNAMSGELAITSELLKALYSDEPGYINDNGKMRENPIAELNLDLNKGYRGNPNIGTVVFDSITAENSYRFFKNHFDSRNDAIIIIGSIFGGTGSSGIPKLIEAIRTDDTNLRYAKVGAIMVMPYFKVGEIDNQNTTPAIQDEIFKSKQKAALTFYNICEINGVKMNRAFDAVYYVAEEDGRQHQNEYSEGGQDQKNNANIVELIAAMGIIDFVQRINDGKNELLDSPILNHYNEYGLKYDCGPNSHLVIDNFVEKDVDGSLKALTRLTLALKQYRDWILAGKPNKKATYYGDNGLKIENNKNNLFYQGLESFTKLYDQWLKELEQVKHSFSPYDFKVETLLKDVVRGYTGKEGGYFSDGISYVDFDSIASKSWESGIKNLQNKEEAFMKVLYDAANKELTHLVPNKKKKK